MIQRIQKDKSKKWDIPYEEWTAGMERVESLWTFEKFLMDFLFKQKEVNPVLDVGCGNGMLMKFLKSFDFDIDGFDISEVGIKIAKENGINAICSSIMDFKPKRKYKTILFISVFPWVSDTESNFKKVASWLEEEGIMIISTGNFHSLKYLLGIRDNRFPKKYNPSYFQFKKLVSSNGLRIKSVNALGKGKFFPYFATVPIYILEKQNDK